MNSSDLKAGQWSFIFYHDTREQVILVNGGPERGKPAGDLLELWGWDGSQWNLIIADENGDDEIVEFLLERGHDVIRVREQFGEGTPDHVIARAADESRSIVLTSDYDYRRLAGWASRSAPTRYPNMGSS